MNKYTLLAATAILSIGAMAANAAPDSVNATLNAGVRITSPFTLTNGDINFGTIATTGRTAQNRIYVKVKPDGLLDETVTNAQMLSAPSVTPMYLSGGTLNGWSSQGGPGEMIASYGTMKGQLESELTEAEEEDMPAIEAQIADYEAKITALSDLTGEEGATTADVNTAFGISLSYDSSFSLKQGAQANSQTCGTVSGLLPSWTWSETNGLEIRFGGTFELSSTFNTDDAYCFGSNTITLVYNPQ